MSQDTHNEHHKENKTIISFKSAFWLVVIVVGLFVAALNFVKAESGPGEEKGEGKEKSEMTSTEPPSAEGQNKAPETVPPVQPVTTDTTGKSAQ
jgi:hypothetical protein